MKPDLTAFFEAIFEHSADGIFISNATELVRVNPAACAMLQRTEDEIRRTPRGSILVDEAALATLHARRAADQHAVGELEYRRADGTTFLAEAMSGLLPEVDGERFAYVIIRDVTEQRRAEERIRRTNRALRIGNHCIEALARANTELALYRAICEIVVETGGYRMCWVGVAEHDARRTVRPVAWAGHVDGYFDRADISWSDGPRGQGPTGTALRNGTLDVGADFETDPRLAPWRDEALRRGYRSSSALPLIIEGETYGVITMYASSREAFSEEELTVLARLSETLAYGIRALRQRRARESAEEAVRRSEAILRGLVEAAPGPLFLKDRESRWLYVNQATLDVVGRKRDEVLGKTDVEIYVDRAIGEALVATDRRIMASGHREEVEERVQGPGGERFYASTKTPYRDREGRVIGLVGIAFDITEKRRAETDLRRLSAAIEQAGEAVIVCDADANIAYVNPAFEAITGYACAEVIGQNPRFLKSGTQDDAFYRALWQTLLSGRTWRGRIINRCKGGALYTAEASISPVRGAQGAVVAYVAVQRDVTHEVAVEAQLFQVQKMEGIGRLAGGVAHDFNNLLSVILSLTELTAAALPSENPLRADVLEIDRAAQRAASLTRQLLAFSRKQVLQPVVLDLNTLVRDTEKMLRRIVGEDVTLVVRCGPALAPVRVDPGQVEQVVMNLVVNARDAMPDGGTLVVETSNVELSDEDLAPHDGARPGTWVALRVTDSGIGMDAETQARMFEPFFTTKPQGKGTGLGLSTVYGIVTQSGGFVTVDSAPGRGTTFAVFLPSAPRAVEGPVTTSQRPIPTHDTGVVLLVEDEESVRRLTHRVLRKAGYTVLVAANGREALALAERADTAIDLVLCDVIMPEMKGPAVVARLRASRPSVKVLYMSGYTDDALGDLGLGDEGVALIVKPFTPSSLLARVRETLDA